MGEFLVLRTDYPRLLLSEGLQRGLTIVVRCCREEAFCELKSYLEVRPVFHWRPDRVRNHVRICFLAYWLSARLGREWRTRQEVGEVVRILRELQSIRVGTVRAGDQHVATLLTEIPPNLNEQLSKLNLLALFAKPPVWAEL